MVELNDKSLDDITGIVDYPVVEGRFQEVLSTNKILDTVTGIEYGGLVDTDLLILINELYDENQRLVKENIHLDARNMDLEMRIKRLYGNE